MISLYALLTGFVLDLLFGDPEWLPHPVVGMGKTISFLEKKLRAHLPATPRGERMGGIVLAVVLPVLSFALPALVLIACQAVSPILRYAVESLMCYQILAARCLANESLRVYRCVAQGDLPAARAAVSRIVGRDTEKLSLEGVTKAAVETVAENASDGEIAPLLFLALGGAPLGFAYKAVNTMDSMVGYRNERYLWFGRAAARLDDVCNFLPARLSGLAMVAVSPLVGLSGRGAWRIFRRDRFNHASPNSAQTEAACAGALGVQLAGDASYFGVVHHKKTIGDATRPVQAEDIPRANRLMFGASALCLATFALARWGVCALLAAL